MFEGGSETNTKKTQRGAEQSTLASTPRPCLLKSMRLVFLSWGYGRHAVRQVASFGHMHRYGERGREGSRCVVRHTQGAGGREWGGIIVFVDAGRFHAGLAACKTDVESREEPGGT